MDSTRFLLVVVVATLVGCGGGGGSTPSSGGGGITPPTVSPVATATPSAAPAPPAAFAAQYALESADISAFASGIAAQCPANPTASTRFDLELLPANANALYSALQGKTVAQAQAAAGNALAYAVAARRLLPGIGFMINPNYPVLVQNQANAPTWWNTAANYPVFSAYYARLAAGLTQNGIPYDIETNLIFPAYSGQSYSGLSIAQLEAGVAEDSSNALTVMPAIQYLNFASEPLTLSQNTGQPTLDTVAGYAGYVSGIRAGIVIPGGSQTKVGAGSADWSSISFLTALEGMSNLGFNNMHLYPPDLLATANGGIAQVDAINPALTGKPGIIAENWDEKDAGNAGAFGAANAQSLEQQNMYSFWAPLDARYITAMMQLARCQNISVASFWYQNELFAYLDYASASMLTPQAAQGAIAQAGAQAALAGTLSPSGQAMYAGLTGHAPMSVMRRR